MKSFLLSLSLAVLAGLTVLSAAGAAATETPVTSLSSGFASGPTDQLRPGDRIRFQIIEDGDEPVDLVIGKDGAVDIPYIGVVTSTGQTVEALADQLKIRLEDRYYVRATVRISLVDRPERSSDRGRVFVTGEVRRVGMVEIDKSETNTAGRVILANGGLSEFADARRVKIFRKNTKGVVETKVLDLREVLEKGRIDLDVPIYDGDLVVVDSKLVSW